MSLFVMQAQLLRAWRAWQLFANWKMLSPISPIVDASLSLSCLLSFLETVSLRPSTGPLPFVWIIPTLFESPSAGNFYVNEHSINNVLIGRRHIAVHGSGPRLAD